MSMPTPVVPEQKRDWKWKLRQFVARAIKWGAPKVADAVVNEVKRRAGKPPAGSGPWNKAGTGKS